MRVFECLRLLAAKKFMDVPNPPQHSPEPRTDASGATTPDASVSVFVRVWSYGGASQPALGLKLDQEEEVGRLIHEVVHENNGRVAHQQPELWCAHFGAAAHAVSAAKALQQRFLTFHRKTEPQQVVPSILIYPSNQEEISGPDVAVPADMLANVSSAQILIAGSIYEQMKSVPGFRFNSQPVREAGETFGPEAIYEMLWTDESTYGHLRQASRAGLKTVGRYQIQQELGRGAMGAVYKAHDELIGRTIALKMIAIDRNAPKREELIERLKQEAKAAGGLDHPNIITIYDVGQEDDAVYLSMQYVKGTTLASMLAEVGVPSLATFLSWADQICAAVGFAHAGGVIHRDLKPANLMVTEEGVIKVLDFGIAKIEDTSLTQTGLVVGTPSYMSPEQLTGKKVDHRADIFALGSVFYELVTRERPFQGDVTSILYKIVHEDPVAPSLINPSIPGRIDAVIRKALAKNPNERFETCEEMRAAFAEQGARLRLAPGIVGAALPATKPTHTPAPQKEIANRRTPATTGSYLLTETSPNRRSVWPVVFVLLFIGGAAWAYYVHKNTGSYPDFLRELLSTSRQQASGDSKPIAPAAENPQNAADDRAQKAGSENSGSGVQTPSPTGSAMESSTPDPATTGQGTNANTSEPADAAPATTQAPEAAGTAAASQPVTSLQPAVSAAVPENTTRSPLPPVSAGAQATTANTVQDPKKPIRQAPLVVDGFTKKNVPELLRVAEIAARRGDYRLAAYEYRLILKLDHENARARIGLRLIQESERLR